MACFGEVGHIAFVELAALLPITASRSSNDADSRWKVPDHLSLAHRSFYSEVLVEETFHHTEERMLTISCLQFIHELEKDAPIRVNCS